MKWTLWIAFLIMVPVPYFMIETGWVPTIRLLLFAVATGSAALAEPDYTSWAMAVMFAIQTLLWGGILYGLARFAARGLDRLTPGPLRLVLLAVILVGLFGGALFEIYRTPLSPARARSNLLGVFQ